jgi:serine/threonine-protein kinase HipA
MKALLPDDHVAEVFIGSLEGQSEPALLIKRFDRTATGRIHFEEFNQLLGHQSFAKYDGSYHDMADFIATTPGCLPTENFRLYGRILAGLLVGNTDMHFKNFAMLHTPHGLRLTPAYDEVAASLYGYETVALALAGASNRRLSELNARHIILLGQAFKLQTEAIYLMVKQLEKRKEAAKQAIVEADVNNPQLKDELINLMEKRWNGTFALIGKALSKKP